MDKIYLGGYKRRLCAALPLVAGARVVFLDEPTSGVDPMSRKTLWDALGSLSRERSLIITTHFIDVSCINFPLGLV